MPHTIFTNLAPNTQWDDALLAVVLLLQPWRWKMGRAVAKLETQLRSFVGTNHAIVLASGRGALSALLQSLNLAPTDEVLLQAYTCVAVPAPVLWVEAAPVYVDCDDTFTMSTEDLRRKISPRSKVLIIQHTFGVVADLDTLMVVAREHNLFVIEDCTHALGTRLRRGGRSVGTAGDAALWSFGRDKVISGVFGGAITTNNDALSQTLLKMRDRLVLPPRWWILQQLFHSIIINIVRSTFDIGIGKILLVLTKQLNLFSRAVLPPERSGKKPLVACWQMPNVSALLCLHQWTKLERFNAHRKKIAALYREGLRGLPLILPKKDDDERCWLRYTVRSPHRDALVAFARRRGVLLGDWYTTPIAPKGVDHSALRFDSATCPNAQQYTRESFNLPTDIHMTLEDVKRIVVVLQSFFERQVKR